MRSLLLTAVAVLGLAVRALAQEQAVVDLSNAPATPPPPPQQQMIDLSLMEALVSVGGQDLAGIFGYVPEQAAAPAFADYLMHNASALKRFMKKARKDIKEAGGINVWDRTVYLNIMQINTAPALPPGVEKLSKSNEFDVSGFILAKPLTLQQMTIARGARR